VKNWLYETGKFSKSGSLPVGKPEGAVRMVICERTRWPKLGFAMSRASFLAIEAALGLGSEALMILSRHNGQYYHKLDGNSDGKPRSISECKKEYPVARFYVFY